MYKKLGVTNNVVSISDSIIKVEEDFDQHKKCVYIFNRDETLIKYTFIIDNNIAYSEDYDKNGDLLLKTGYPIFVNLRKRGDQYYLSITYFSRSNNYTKVMFATNSGDTVMPKISQINPVTGVSNLSYSNILIPKLHKNGISNFVIYMNLELKDRCTQEISILSDSTMFEE